MLRTAWLVLTRPVRAAEGIIVAANDWMWRQRPIWLLLFASAAYWLISPWVSRDLLFQMLNAVIMCLATAVSIAFAPNWLPSLFRKHLTPPEQFLLAFGMLSVFVASVRGWSLVWRVMSDDKFPATYPTDMLHSLTLGYLIYGATICYGMFLMTPGAVDYVPKMRWIITGAAVGAGVLIASVTFIALN